MSTCAPAGWVDETTGVTVTYRNSLRGVHRYDLQFPGAPAIWCEATGAPIEHGTLEGVAELLTDEVLAVWARFCAAERAAYVTWLKQRGYPAIRSSIPLSPDEIASFPT